MSDRHTPGPWGKNGQTVLVRGISWLGFANYENREATANARLIAAAPDLLDAVEDALPHVHNDRVTDMMRAAIAKARGADFAPRPDDVGQSDG